MAQASLPIFSHACLQEAGAIPREVGARLDAAWLRMANRVADAASEAREGRASAVPASGLAWSGPAPLLAGIDPDRMGQPWRAFLEGLAWGRKAFKGADNMWLGAFWASLCCQPDPRSWLAERPGARLRLAELGLEIERQGQLATLAAHQAEDGLARGLALGLSMAREPAACWMLLPGGARQAAARRVHWAGWSLPWQASLADRARAEAMRPFLPGARARRDERSWRLSRLAAVSELLPRDDGSTRACAGALADEAMLAWLGSVDREAARSWRQACLLAFPHGLGELADELSERGAEGAARALAEPLEEAETRALRELLAAASDSNELGSARSGRGRL